MVTIKEIKTTIEDVISNRKMISSIPIRDISDIIASSRIYEQSKKSISDVTIIANSLIGILYAEKGKRNAISKRLNALATYITDYTSGNANVLTVLDAQSKSSLTDFAGDQPLIRRPLPITAT